LLLFWSSKKVKENRLGQQGEIGWCRTPTKGELVGGGTPTKGER
jgi:hypothetical protein